MSSAILNEGIYMNKKDKKRWDEIRSKSYEEAREVSEVLDKNLISQALKFWANHIETGNLTLNAKDIELILKSEDKKDPYRMRTKGEIKALSEDQMELVLRLRKLSKKVMEI